MLRHQFIRRTTTSYSIGGMGAFPAMPARWLRRTILIADCSLLRSTIVLWRRCEQRSCSTIITVWRELVPRIECPRKWGSSSNWYSKGCSKRSNWLLRSSLLWWFHGELGSMWSSLRVSWRRLSTRFLYTIEISRRVLNGIMRIPCLWSAKFRARWRVGGIAVKAFSPTLSLKLPTKCHQLLDPIGVVHSRS